MRGPENTIGLTGFRALRRAFFPALAAKKMRAPHRMALWAAAILVSAMTIAGTGAFSPATAATINLTTSIYTCATNGCNTGLVAGFTNPAGGKTVVAVPGTLAPNTTYTLVVGLDLGGITFTGYSVSIELDSGFGSGGHNEVTYVSGSAMQLTVPSTGMGTISFATGGDPNVNLADGTPRAGSATVTGGSAKKARVSDNAIFSLRFTVGPKASITADDIDITGLFDLKFTPTSLTGLSGGHTAGTTATGIQLIPEPGTFFLTGLGLAGLAAVRRRRRQDG